MVRRPMMACGTAREIAPPRQTGVNRAMLPAGEQAVRPRVRRDSADAFPPAMTHAHGDGRGLHRAWADPARRNLS